MSIFASPRFLHRVLFADAALSLATGAVQVGAAANLAPLLHLPAGLLAGSGWIMLGWAAAVGWVATRDPLPLPLVLLLAAGNLAWALGSVALLAGGWLAPGPLGAAWVLAQAAVVAVLGELQWTGARRGRSPRPA